MRPRRRRISHGIFGAAALSAPKGASSIARILFQSLGNRFSFPARSWWSLLALGLGVQVVAWWFITWGMGHVPTNLGAMGLMVQPVATVILGWLLLSEALRPLQAVGTLFVLAGIALCAFTPPIPERA